jgi:hypothetical protein
MPSELKRLRQPKGEMVNDLLAQSEGPLPYKVLIA